MLPQHTVQGKASKASSHLQSEKSFWARSNNKEANVFVPQSPLYTDGVGCSAAAELAAGFADAFLRKGSTSHRVRRQGFARKGDRGCVRQSEITPLRGEIQNAPYTHRRNTPSCARRASTTFASCFPRSDFLGNLSPATSGKTRITCLEHELDRWGGRGGF